MKSTHLSALLFLFVFIYALPSVASDRWSRIDQEMSELDAEIEKLNGKPEVRIETRIVEKVIIKEVLVPVPVSMPAPTPVASPVVPVALIPEELIRDNAVTVEADGYVFKLSACRLSHRNMKCNLSILNTENDGDLTVFSKSRYNQVTRLFDRSGNEYFSNKILMGNKSNNAFVKNRYIAGVTVRGMLHFENLSNNTKAIALIELGVTNHGTGKYNLIKFRNIALSI